MVAVVGHNHFFSLPRTLVLSPTTAVGTICSRRAYFETGHRPKLSKAGRQMVCSNGQVADDYRDGDYTRLVNSPA